MKTVHRKAKFSTMGSVQDPRLHITKNKALFLLALSFQQNPQDSSSSYRDNVKLKVGDDCRVGNVEKLDKLHKISVLPLSTCEKIVRSRLAGCQRQVYVSMEIAESTARSFLKIGIVGVPERCGRCKQVHLKESPQNQIQNV